MSESETAEVVRPKGVKGVGNGHLSWHGSTPEFAYHCRNLEDLRVALKHQIEQQSGSLVPELVVSRFQFGLNASLDRVEGVQQDGGTPDAAPLAKDDSPDMNYSVPGALSNFFDQKDKLRYQRPVAKLITKAIQEADGFKYFERRCNDTSTSDGYRFFMICCDSIQNKFRHGNRKSQTQEPENGGNGDGGDADAENAENAEQRFSYRPKRDTFDCRGHFKIIFSIKHLCIDVLYRHLPIHRQNTALRPKPAQTIVAPEQPNVLDTPWPPALPPGVSHDPDYQPDGTGKGKKRKRSRPTKSQAEAKAAAAAALQANAALTNAAMASSATSDAQNLNTLVDALQADMAGNGTITGSTHEGYVPAPSTCPPSSGQHRQTTGEVPAAAPKKKQKSSKQESLKQVNSQGRVVRVTTGCITCRSRRIKCDEGKPACDNCSKKDRQCVYQAGERTSSVTAGLRATYLD